MKSLAAVSLVLLAACSSTSGSSPVESTTDATVSPSSPGEPTWIIDVPVDPSIWTSVGTTPEWAKPSFGRPAIGPVSPALPDADGRLADGVYRLEILYSPDQSDRPPQMAMIRRFAGCDEFVPALTGDFCTRGEGMVLYPGEGEESPPDLELALDDSTRVVVRTRACLGEFYDDNWLVDWPTFVVSMKEFADSTRQWSQSLLGLHGIAAYTGVEDIDYSLPWNADLQASDCLERAAWSPAATIDAPLDGDRQPVPWFFPIQTWAGDAPLTRIWQSTVVATAIEVSAGRYTIYFDAVAMPFREYPE